MTVARRALSLVPLALAIVGISIPLVGDNFRELPLGLIWFGVIAVVVVATRINGPSRQARVFLGLAALAWLFLLAYEGGWWLIPAVLTQMALDARTVRSNA